MHLVATCTANALGADGGKRLLAALSNLTTLRSLDLSGAVAPVSGPQGELRFTHHACCMWADSALELEQAQMVAAALSQLTLLQALNLQGE